MTTAPIAVAPSEIETVESKQGSFGEFWRYRELLYFFAWRDTVIELVRSPELILEFERRIKSQYRAVTWLQSAARLAELLRPLRNQPS